MWQSQDDIIRDLASLNDFGSPEDKEPYKALYSIGRGSKFKEKNANSGRFIDSRTGEVINVQETLDNYCKGRGRGSLLGGYSRSKFQLQQQLRLARPLGSGDGAIESYYRRNDPAEGVSSGLLDSETNSKSGETNAENFNLDKTKHRIKAVRHSSTGSNALINGLLTKLNKSPEIQLNSSEVKFVRNEEEETEEDEEEEEEEDDDEEKERKENSDEILNFSRISINSGDSGGVVENGCNTGNPLENLSDVDKSVTGEDDGKSDSFKDTFNSSGKSGIKDSQNYSENNFYDAPVALQDRNEKYRLLGEKLNRLRKTDPKASESGMYVFSELSRCIAPIDNVSETNCVTVIAPNPVRTSFTVKEEDFPPLL